MKNDFFTNLPSELTTNILSRISARSLAISKSVCKPWRDLFESGDFVKSRLSIIKSPSVLVRLISTKLDSTRCTIFEIEDKDEANTESNDLHYIMPLTNFGIPNTYSAYMAGMAANGLLLLYSVLGHAQIPLIICNPITRQYIRLLCPEECISEDFKLRFGFGVSKLSGQYKVVCLNGDAGSDPHYAYVYTLGTRTWRRVETGAAFGFELCRGGCVICNGNLHWIVNNSIHPVRICGFDIETECFSIFTAPPMIAEHENLCIGVLSVLRDCLCIFYSYPDKIVIWLMNKYQVEESWTIECTLSTSDITPFVNPIKAFKDGDILMLLNQSRLIYYSNKTGTTKQVGMFKDAAEVENFTHAMIFNPSLFSFKSFGIENFISF